MQYGHKGWAEWVIDNEDEVVKHIKYAFVTIPSLHGPLVAYFQPRQV